MNQQPQNYTTTDLALAAALVEGGHLLDHVDVTNPRRVSFVFVRSGELSVAVANYWQEKLLVNPKRYFDTIRHLKSRIYAS